MTMHSEKTTRFDFKPILLKFWRYKWIFLISIIVAVGFAYVNNKFSTTIYQNTTQVHINVNQNNNYAANNERIQTMRINNPVNSLETEIGKLNSFPLIKKALSRLNFEVSYHMAERPFQLPLLKEIPYRVEREIYKDSPFQVEFYQSHKQLINLKFYITILSKREFLLQAHGTHVPVYNYIDNKVERHIDTFHINKKFRFGEQIETDNYKFFVNLKNENMDINQYRSKSLFFRFYHMDYLTLSYLNKLQLTPTGRNSSLVDVAITGSHSRKITDFLNELTQVYINKDLNRKNRKAESTVDYIERQISDVSSSLRSAGNTLERYRSQHKIVDLDYQGQQMYEALSNLRDEKASIVVQQKYYQQIRDYIKNNKVSELTAPSSRNMSDPMLSNLIQRLTDLHSERIEKSSDDSKNLYAKQLNDQIENLKSTIQENVERSLKNLDISLEEINYRIDKLSADLSQLPERELRLQAMEREFELNDEIYTYLLEKRAEAQISRASNFPSYEIVDPARELKASIVAPSTRLNYMIALVIGVLIPAAFLLITDYFNSKIRSTDDLEHITNLPIVGSIFHLRKKADEVEIQSNPHSLTSESIRSIRTNLQLLNGNQSSHVILVTSSRSHEGKTFSSINLAQGFSMLEKKTILLGYDLRKPKLPGYFHLDDQKGLTTYLTSYHTLADVIQSTENEHLDVICEGPLPPNPVELIESSRSRELINMLKQQYEYIILDTSPIGVVPDSKLLMNLADTNLFVTRQNFTRKHVLIHTLKNLQVSKISNIYMVLNDFSPQKHQMGYMYKYYSEKPEKAAY